MKIVVTGSIAFDYLMSFPGRFTEVILPEQLQNISLSFLVDSMKRERGGTAPNIAYTIALLGGRPTMMATAGQDFDEYRAWLEAQGVDTSATVTIADDYTASFFVNTDLDHNQIASFYTGAMAHANKLTFAEYAADADLVIISPNDPTAMNAYVNECKQLGIPYIYDSSQQTIRLSGEELANGVDGCYLLTVNEYEFSLIQERTGWSAAEILAKAGGVLVTQGSKGSWLYVDGTHYDIPIFPPEKVVEPTGAGDAYRAGLMRGLQLGLSWEIAARMGALCSTYVIEQLGTQQHHFTPTEFVTRFRQYQDDGGELNKLLAVSN